MRLLNGLGYRNVRDYPGGLEDWKNSGGLLEGGSVSTDTSVPAPAAPPTRRAVYASISSRRRQWGNAILDLIERRSTSRLFLVWLAIIFLSAFAYWVAAMAGIPSLVEHGNPVPGTLQGLAAAIYFSFVTATSVGYGDLLPVGLMRIVAITEAVTSLLIFGALIAKFVSRRQEQLVSEIHRVTFEERLDRVQINLHLVLSELQAVAEMCERRAAPAKRVASRLESAVLVFASELRTVHDLLYQPRQQPAQSILEAILMSLASSLDELRDVVSCLPPDFERSDVLSTALKTIAALAQEICGECVPGVYAAALTVWMNRVQELARQI